MDFEQAKDSNLLVKINGLTKYFPVYGGLFGRKIGDIKAVDNISFDIYKGETLGLVGESGCGKSTTGRTIINLYEPTSGNVDFVDYNENKIIDVFKKKDISLRKKMQAIFQDPYASLNPRLNVKNILMEPLVIHGIGKNKKERIDIIVNLLEQVGLKEDSLNRYPHEFSGGQKQRIGIARALSLKPDLIIADEPVSALDVSVQAQVLNLMREIQKKMGIAYLFIAHDLSVVKYISDRIAVMYLGNIVEIAGSSNIYSNPMHPYTKALLSAVPVPDPDRKNKDRIMLHGDVPNPMNKPSGCAFRTRCIYAEEICSKEIPELKEISKGHKVACHRARELNKIR